MWHWHLHLAYLSDTSGRCRSTVGRFSSRTQVQNTHTCTRLKNSKVVLILQEIMVTLQRLFHLKGGSDLSSAVIHNRRLSRRASLRRVLYFFSRGRYESILSALSRTPRCIMIYGSSKFAVEISMESC